MSRFNCFNLVLLSDKSFVPPRLARRSVGFEALIAVELIFQTSDRLRGARARPLDERSRRSSEFPVVHPNAIWGPPTKPALGACACARAAPRCLRSRRR